MAAARAMLDEDYGYTQSQDPSDENSYHLGRIKVHNVVLACLPGTCGTASAAFVATQMSRSFPSIKIGLMVGIGGGVPTRKDIRLGDVVVSKPDDTFGGVVQYDFGKRTVGGTFQRTGCLNKPPQALRSALSAIEAEHLMRPPQLGSSLRRTLQDQPEMQEHYSRPHGRDDLYRPEYDHFGQTHECSQCDQSMLIPRQSRSPPTEPKIHYGTIASGNSVIKDGISRDKLIDDSSRILCVEMEAAGLMDHFPCLVIRGICDYADSHKNDGWQSYAAAIAAMYTKTFLTFMKPRDVEKTVPVQQAVFPSHQLPPTLGQPFLQRTIPYSDYILPESGYISPQQSGSLNQRPLGLRQQSTTQAICYPDQLSLEQGQPSQQRSISPSSQYRPGLLQSHTQPTISRSNQSSQQPPIQQSASPFNQHRPGLLQSNTQPTISQPNQSSQQPPIQQSASSVNQSRPGLLQSHTQPTISRPNQSSPVSKQPPMQQSASTFNQHRPGLGQRPAHSTSVLSAGVAPPTHQQPPHTLNKNSNSDLASFGHKNGSQKPGGIQKTVVGSRPGKVPGYKHPSEMGYPQPPKMSYSSHLHQPIHNDLSSAIPLRSLARPQHESIRPSAPGVIYSTAKDSSTGYSDTDSEDKKPHQQSISNEPQIVILRTSLESHSGSTCNGEVIEASSETSSLSSSEADAPTINDVASSPSDDGGTSEDSRTSTPDAYEGNNGEENGYDDGKAVDSNERSPSEADDGGDSDNCDCSGCFGGCCNNEESDQDGDGNCDCCGCFGGCCNDEEGDHGDDSKCCIVM
ncbi:MAG: hypothetical protein M1836_005035 [Candelina mexicana]|nr:MAG: hypothetical protein M1836_005035 [Candelina mexicana]